MRKQEYYKYLKTPEWKAKRLEILTRDNYTCQKCGATNTKLHVHHLQYRNIKPWEYDNSELITLCEKCHCNTHGIIYQKHIKQDQQDDFIMVFFKSFDELQDLDGALFKLLFVIWRECSFNPKYSDEGNIITNDLYFKRRVRERGLDYTDNAINTYITRLAKQNILIKLCKGRYMLNPRYFFKGRLMDASKLQLILEVDDNNDNINCLDYYIDNELCQD